MLALPGRGAAPGRACASRPPRTRRSQPCCRASSSHASDAGGKLVASVAVDAAPDAPPQPQPGPPGAGALALLAFAALALLVWKPWKGRRGAGSVDGLASRGVGLSEERSVDDARYYKGMMAGVRTMDHTEISEEVVAAARARRREQNAADAATSPPRRGGGAAPGGLSSYAVPRNHPWASSEPVDAASEAVRREEVLRRNRTARRNDAKEAPE